MHYIRHKTLSLFVSFLHELIGKNGHKFSSSGYFESEAEVPVKNFQMKNLLVIVGEIGLKT
ncbi:hypothetical protein C8N25_102143 [Algoriphagus antarcticus]|uniref:Uncharacterized protein n=1 Tax=Algoriphagus antarcticus TaxID=238540 RepID=A0A3E0E554_9BACT|nr:hypothetical protein C8N25_102143 [Algoriphagus antarcticus]